MKRIFVFPTWALAMLAQPALPYGHVWKHKLPSLTHWAANSTHTNDLFNGILWANTIIAAITLVSLWVR